MTSFRKNLQAYFIFLLSVITINSGAQISNLNDSIAKYRKGEIVVVARKGDKITIEQLRHEFWFGCAISNSLVSGKLSETDNRQYREKFLMNFNSAVTENALKWLDMERQKGEPNYSNVDGILSWTEENKIPLRGHNLFWGIPQFIQPWLKELNNEELRKTMKNRAETISAKYKGRFAEYDLNNEMIHGNYYEDRLGAGITKEMADWVHTGDPDAKLFVNDYDILTGKRLNDYMAHIRKLRAQGVPVAGIGVQGHLHAETFDRNELRRALDSLAKFGLPIRITEFNMPGQRSKYYEKRMIDITPEEEELEAKELADYYKICFAHPAVEGIIMWGFWAGANWIPVSSLYRRDWSPTPLEKAYRNLVFNEWWTRAEGTAGKKGIYSAYGFFGKYRITVNGVSKEIDLTKAAGKVTVDFTQKKK
ncbi:MAG TPA: endo-1,4-beta-xylanase [Bacteroidales bacterium]|nr:endo-1,4-beta-xylanase [Bacteroidales bacterium]